jgi:hypothetical protein
VLVETIREPVVALVRQTLAADLPAALTVLLEAPRP